MMWWIPISILLIVAILLMCVHLVKDHHVKPNFNKIMAGLSCVFVIVSAFFILWMFYMASLHESHTVTSHFNRQNEFYPELIGIVILGIAFGYDSIMRVKKAIHNRKVF